MSFSKGFIDSLKVLFDVLDERRSGSIKYDDLVMQTQAEGQEGLPSTVLSVLRSFRDENGNLTFENLVKGFEIVRSRQGKLPSADSSGQSLGKDLVNGRRLGSNNGSAFQRVDGQNVHLQTNGYSISNSNRTNMLHSKSDDMLNVEPNLRFPEYHGDFFRPKEKWDRKPGDGRSSVATSSALEHMSKFTNVKLECVYLNNQNVA